jgi:hypothetical protein
MSSPTTPTPAPESTATERGTERRSTLETVRLAVFYLALLAAAAMTVLFLGGLLQLLVVGWLPALAAELGIHRLHVMGIALLVGTFLVGLFVQTYRPTRRVAAMWGSFLAITVVTVGTLAFGVGRPEEVVPFFLVTGVMVLVHPAGRDLLRRGESYSPVLLALLAVAAVPLLAFAANQVAISGSASDPHYVDGHYVMMIGLALTPLAFGIPAALGFAGWRLAAWLAALPMGYYGAMSIAFPAQSGSTGTLWGVAAIGWAIAFVVVAEYARVAPENPTLRREFARTG